MIPEAVAPDIEFDQNIFPEESEVRTLHDPAPVGIRRAEKFAVQRTSSM
jgi:hypothetical protein